MAKRKKPPRFDNIKDALKKYPLSVQHMIAERAAPRLTRALNAFFQSRTGLDGVPYPISRVTGRQLTLKQGGATAGYLYFEADGSLLMARLRTPYAQFLVGKYKILPLARMALPSSMLKIIERTAEEVREAGFGVEGGA